MSSLAEARCLLLLLWKRALQEWCCALEGNQTLTTFSVERCTVSPVQHLGDHCHDHCFFYPILMALTDLPIFQCVVFRTTSTNLCSTQAVHDFLCRRQASGNITLLDLVYTPSRVDGSSTHLRVSTHLQKVTIAFQFTREEFVAVASLLRESTN